MRGFLAVYRRELAGLFLAPLAWVLLCVALALKGFFFTFFLKALGGDVDQALQLDLGQSVPYWALMLLLPPLLTMRMISEESRAGVLEFLLTAPVTDLAVVLGKLLAATTFLALLWGSALVYGGVLALLGAAPDWGALLGAWLGSVMLSALFCAIGLVASALSGTPLLAAFLAAIVNLSMFSLHFLRDQLGRFLNLPPGHWSEDALRQVDVAAHFNGSFALGVLDSAHVVFFLAWTAFFTFLAVRLVEVRRWR